MYNFNPVTREYLTSNIDFVRSMVFKRDTVIEVQNKHLSDLGYIIPLDPKEFKYYLNLNGQYHESDDTVYVLSSDTGERIPFTKETLVDHPITQIDYSPGGTFHRELLEANPQQRHWIDRVLDPVDMDVAIAADDHQLLAYDASFIAVNETTLINRIQSWAYGYAQRWHDRDMIFRQPLYAPSDIHVFTLALVKAVIAIRYENVRTGEVDDYHLWAFLGSRYRLDRYRRHLSNKQALWLYRNIEYLRHHAGKERTMEQLLEHIAKPSNIVADRFDIARTYEGYLETGKTTSTVLVNGYEVDRPSYAIENRETVSYAHLLTVESGRENFTNLEDDIAYVEKHASMTDMRTVPTGQVRLRVGRPITDVYFDERYVKIAQWFYLTEKGYMGRTHNVSLGSRGELSLSDREACLLFQYAMGQILETTLEQPFTMNLQAAHHDKGISETAVEMMLNKKLSKEGYAGTMSKRWVPFTLIRNAEEWGDYISNVKYRWFQHYLAVHEVSEADDRGLLNSVMTRLYRGHAVTLSLGNSNYEQWLDAMRFPRNTMTTADYLNLISELLDVAVDLILDENGISEKHKAIMEIVKLFAPYSMVFTAAGDLNQSIPMAYQAYQPFNPAAYHGTYTYSKLGVNGGRVSNVTANALDGGRVQPTPKLETVGHQDPIILKTLGYRALQVANGGYHLSQGLRGGAVEVTIIT